MTLEKTKRDGPGKRGMIFAEFIRSDWQSQILAKVVLLNLHPKKARHLL